MDILTAEEKLAQWVENTTGMSGKVYRSVLPRGIREGFEVRLISGRPRSLNSLNEFTIELRGVSPDRRELWDAFEKIFAAMPLQKYEEILYADIKEEVQFAPEEKEGLALFSGKVKISAAFG